MQDDRGAREGEGGAGELPATLSFTRRLLASDAFPTLFREGMSLVEATAAYLDGPGREEARTLDRSLALAYASESMRLTTRLMQLTSWLLLQRAVREGELTSADAERENRRVHLPMQESAAAAALFNSLPERLKELVIQSLGLQRRIEIFDQELRGETPQDSENPIARQLDLLAAAFQR